MCIYSCFVHLSLVVSSVDTARSRTTVQASIGKLRRESIAEFLRSGVKLGGHLDVVRLHRSIVHVAGHEKRVANFDGLFGVSNLVSLSREVSRLAFGQFDQFFVSLNLFINLSIEFTTCAHILQHLVLESSLRVLQSHCAVTLKQNFNNARMLNIMAIFLNWKNGIQYTHHFFRCETKMILDNWNLQHPCIGEYPHCQVSRNQCC